jgi:2-keto-3-deoxy-L-rhamnonate aldolase RhmA
LDASSPSRFAARLRGGEALLGTVLTLPGVALAELVAEPLDFVWIDLEHGALDVAEVSPLAVAARAAGSAALVRLAGGERLAAILDAGVDGVVAPRVESAAQARRLADRLTHPPHGSRGFAARRANGYGRPAAAPTPPLLLAQIESAAGVEAAAEIAAVDGVAALVIGCADLALALDGSPAPDSARLRAAIGRVQDGAAAAGIASGIAGPDDPAVLADLAGGRSRLLVCSADVRIYARAVDELAQRLRTPEPETIGVGA